MTYIETNHIIVAIMNCKRKYFNEEYITYEELNIIRSEIQKEFNNANIKAIIDSSYIDQNYFELKEVISLNKPWAEVQKYYQNITNTEIIKILLNEKFILDLLLKISKQKITNAENKQKNQASNSSFKKNLLLEYKNKLNNIKSIKSIDEKYLQSDFEFYKDLREYYKFLTEDLYNILNSAIINTNKNNMNNPFIEFRYNPEETGDITKRGMFLNFLDKYYLSTKKEVYCTAKGTTILKIYHNLKDLLDAYYLELERLEYLYYPEELGLLDNVIR